MFSSFMPSPRILIIKPSSMGDIIHTLPLLRSLRAACPQAFIAWIVESSFKDILTGDKDIDDLIVIHTRRWRRKINFETMGDVSRAAGRLRKGRFDVAIDLQGLLKSGVIAWLSGAKVRVGFNKSDMREGINSIFLTKQAEPARPCSHAIDRSLTLLEPLGVSDFKEEYGLDITADDKGPAEEFFKEHEVKRPLVAVNPGVGFSTKQWNLEKYAALSDMLMDKLGCSVLLTWGPGEKKMIDTIASKMKHRPLVPPLTTIRQSAGFFLRADLFIGSDTGPMHLCAALGIKGLVLMGSTDPVRNGPAGHGHTVIQKDIECKNCYMRKCDLMDCMKSIQVDEVFDAAVKMLASSKDV